MQTRDVIDALMHRRGAPDAASDLFSTLGPWKQTPAELAAGVTPVNYAYGPGDVRRYGADRTGSASSTAAWNNAIAQRKQGGAAIFVPSGLYKIALVITGADVRIVGESNNAADVATVGLIADNNAAPVIQVGDGTTATSDFYLANIKMHGQGTAQFGLNVAGAQRCFFDNVSAIGFTGYSCQVTASTSVITDYIFFSQPNFAAYNVANAWAFQISQPSNYPTSYCTAVYLDAANIQAGALAAGCINIGNASTSLPTYLNLSNAYIGPKQAGGITLQNANCRLYCDDVTVDDGVGGNVLVTFVGFTQPFSASVSGTFTVNGKYTDSSGTSNALSFASYVAYNSYLHTPRIAGVMDFQDTSLSAPAQTVAATQGQKIFRSSSNLQIVNTGGALILQGSQLQLLNAAGTGDGKIDFSSSAVQILTGTGSPAASLPNGSLYLQTDAGAASPLWVRANSAWTQMALP